MRTFLLLFVLLGGLLLPGSAWAQATRVVDLRPQWDSVQVLKNPHKGWYHHYYDNSTGNYLTRADTDLDNFPGLNHLYLRLAWSYLEPTEGRFNWALLDNVINKWVAKGYTISFRITCKETEITYATPEWVKNAGAKGNFYTAWGQPNWEPDYGDPVFLAKLDNFHRAFAARYNGATWLEYVDVGSVGDWGEGHTSFSSKRDWPVEVVKKHFDIYRKYYTVPIYLSDDFVGGRSNSDGSATQIRQYATQLGLHWRDDSMLVKWYVDTNGSTYSISAPSLFTDSWRSRATLLEAQHYAIQKNEGVWQGTDGAVKGADVLLGALKLTHASYIGYHGYADEWLAENPSLARKVANRVGYWYFPRYAELPVALPAGGSGSLKINWENHGVAPAYHAFRLKLKLESSTNTYAQDLTEANNRSWLPGSGTTETYAVQAPAVAGTYRIRVALVEEGTSQFVRLALRDATRGADGYYTIGTVEVSAAASLAGVYRLVARHSGKALDINGASTADGAAAIQWTDRGSLNQLWRIEAAGSGTYKLTAQHSGKVLHVAGASTADGARVHQQPDNGAAAQRWKIAPTTDDYYTLTNAGSGKCLDIYGGPAATTDGAEAVQWAYKGGTNQQWKLVLVSAAPTLVATVAAAASLQAYPNPSPDGRATLRLTAHAAQRASVQVYNQHGRPVSRLTVPVADGQTDFRLPSTLAPGTYYLRTVVDGRKQHFTLEVR